MQVIYSDDRLKCDCTSEAMSLPDELVSTKLKDWHYEKEWRVVRDREAADYQIRSEAGEVSLFNIDPRAISQIIVGARASGSTRDRLREAIESNAALGHVRLRYAELNSGRIEFDLT